MIKFFVPGVPRTAGSKKVLPAGGKRGGRPIVVEDGTPKSREAKRLWRNQVQVCAAEAYGGPPLTGPLHLQVVFCMPRPKGHFRSGKRSGELRENAPRHHTSKPDRTKLLRCIEDAMTHVLWQDDSQVVAGPTNKRYAINGRVGAQVCVTRLDDDDREGTG